LSDLENDFEAAVFGMHPGLGELRQHLVELGAPAARLSGSGAALFGVFPDRAVLERALPRFPSEQLQVLPTQVMTRARYRASWLRSLSEHVDGSQWPPKAGTGNELRPPEDHHGQRESSAREGICRELGIELAGSTVKAFSDGEIWVQLDENVRGADVFIVQPTSTPADRHLMELLLISDALKRASARRITAVLPYYGYARQTARTGRGCRSRQKSWRRCWNAWRGWTGFWR